MNNIQVAANASIAATPCHGDGFSVTGAKGFGDIPLDFRGVSPYRRWNRPLWLAIYFRSTTFRSAKHPTQERRPTP